MEKIFSATVEKHDHGYRWVIIVKDIPILDTMLS